MTEAKGELAALQKAADAFLLSHFEKVKALADWLLFRYNKSLEFPSDHPSPLLGISRFWGRGSRFRGPRGLPKPIWFFWGRGREGRERGTGGEGEGGFPPNPAPFG